MERKLGAALRAWVLGGGLLWALAGLAGCTSNNIKKQYLLAEKLWGEGNYSSAVAEFDKVTAKDPKGNLGLRALYRSAATQMLFQSQYGEAARKFKTFAEAPGADPGMAWDAQKQLGEILYSKTEQYDRAIQLYQALLKQKPDAPEAPEFMFRMAKSHFFLWQFDSAAEVYREMIAKFPETGWSEKASYEIGVTYSTRGEQKVGGHGRAGEKEEKGIGAYQEATEAYQKFIKNFPRSPLVPQAKFGIASCLEELDQLDAAYRAYEALKTTYPSPNVIAIKLARIRERQAQRSR